MKSFRPERVASVVQAVVSDAIANQLNDPRIERLSSVTRVQVSADLEYAKVYVSVMGEPSVQRRTMAGLCSAAGHVQRLVAQALPLRTCPRLSFHLDESIKKGAEMIRLIEETMAQSPVRPDTPGQASDQDPGEGGTEACGPEDQPAGGEADVSSGDVA